MDKTKFIGKHYGWLKIKDVIATEGMPNVVLIFEDDKEDNLEISEILLEKFVTEDKVEPTEFRERVVGPVVEQVLEVLLKNQLRLEWVDYVFQTAANSLNGSIMRASERMWGKKMFNRTIQDVDNQLKKA